MRSHSILCNRSAFVHKGTAQSCSVVANRVSRKVGYSKAAINFKFIKLNHLDEDEELRRIRLAAPFALPAPLGRPGVLEVAVAGDASRDPNGSV